MSSIVGERKQWGEKLFAGACLAAVVLPLGLLLALLVDVVVDAWPKLSLDFLSGFTSSRADKAGILPGLVGSILLILYTALLALPIGIGAAIYLEEYSGKTRLAGILEVTIANLAGVPSIIYGLLGLGLFVRALGMGRSLLAGACTLALLILPIVIVSTREALRTIPGSIREGCHALGATRWQMIRQVVLPTALPGVMTGAILSLSRAIGETAPLIIIGVFVRVPFLPTDAGWDPVTISQQPFTAMPVQINTWIEHADKKFHENAAAGIVVLLLTMLTLNLAAILIRSRMQRRHQ